MQKLIVFIYTSNILYENKIKEILPFTVTTNWILKISVTKGQDFCTKTKKLLNYVKDYLSKQKHVSCL